MRLAQSRGAYDRSEPKPTETEQTDFARAQRSASSRTAHTVPNGRLFSYTSEDEGDHFLMLKNPLKFVADMQAFMAE